jgi:hypothetical protein
MLSLDLVWTFQDEDSSTGSGFRDFSFSQDSDSGLRFKGFPGSGFRGLRFRGLFRLDIFDALTIQRCSVFMPLYNLFDKGDQTFDFRVQIGDKTKMAIADSPFLNTFAPLKYI